MQKKYSVVTLRLTEEEKELLQVHSFKTCTTISDIIRDSLKMYFEDREIFETQQERRARQWIL